MFLPFFSKKAKSLDKPSDDWSSHHSHLRSEIENTFTQIRNGVQKILEPPPKYPYAPSNADNTPPTGPISDLASLDLKDAETVVEYLVAQRKKGPVNDNDLLLEKMIRLVSKLPPTSANAKALSFALVKHIFEASPHSSPTVIEGGYQYREADGSNNSISRPDLGKASTPYARLAKPLTIQKIDLPDPGQVFDNIMARPEGEFEEHPNKISSMLFYLADIIAQDLFKTSRKNEGSNQTSSYLDLSPLYGNSDAEVSAMRTFQHGMLKPDCFSEKRVLQHPPGTGVLLIMFNRMHNSVVSQLAMINEAGRFDRPPDDLSEGEAEAAWAKYDNDLFQTGRLVTCGLYVNIILKDYVRTALNLQRTDSTWDLDPRMEGGDSLTEQQGVPHAVGNQVSMEFNFLYHWHSVISPKDADWTVARFAEWFPDQDPATLDWHQLVQRLSELDERTGKDPMKRSFAGLKRQQDGNYDDTALVDILKASIEDVAGSFGAKKVPKVFRSIEMLGILRARRSGLSTLNEFRAFLGLTKHMTMEDINPDPAVAGMLKSLYDHPDSVELYPGLVVEKTKPSLTPGAGLCLPWTTSTVILSEAFSAVRGDRFYTVDYTPKSLTNWGYTEVQPDPTIDGGHVIYKLILSAFPKHFKGNSVYAHFPFTVPSESHVILEELEVNDLYDWSPPKRVQDPVVISSYEVVTSVLSDKVNFPVPKGPAIIKLTSHSGKSYGGDSCLAGDGPSNLKSRQLFMKSLYINSWQDQARDFFEHVTVKLLHKYSYKMDAGYQVDIVRDIGNLAPVHFVAELFMLPLKTDESPRGIYTEHELYLVIALIIICVFFNINPSKEFALNSIGRAVTQQLGQIITPNVEFLARGGQIAETIETLYRDSKLRDYGAHMIRRLLDGERSVQEVVWEHIVLCAPPAVMIGQFFGQSINFFLGDGAKHLPEIQRLSRENTKEADEKLLKYVMEGTRLSHTLGGFRAVKTTRTYQDFDPTQTPADGAPERKPVTLPAGSLVFTGLRTASLDPTVFPNPHEVDLTRDMSLYCQWGWGPHTCAGMDYSRVALTAMLKVIGRLDNLRFAPGPQGRLKAVPAPFGATQYMTADQSGFAPFPTTLKVQWDGELP